MSQQQAEASYQKAAGAELAKDLDKAFRLYVSAAEQYLHLSRQGTDNGQKKLFKSCATKALERAEKIKAVKRDLKPVAKDEFSDGEQLHVLQKSSLINSGHFPLWDSADKPSANQPALSTDQIAHGATWRKVDRQRLRLPLVPSQSSLDPELVVQHIVSDCSVCGALVVAIDHHRRFKTSLILSSLYPQDANGAPVASDTGQYDYRILYNGAHRRVSIDDQLPTDPNGALMCVSTGVTGAIWPSLVEKAYMKLAGGYDFMGSDSSTDLHALAGWIPEVVDLKGPHLQRERTWNRLVQGYISGKCVVTLGTGEHVPQVASPLALLPTHCYAVIGAQDSGEERLLTVFDPWIHPEDREQYPQKEESTTKQQRSVTLSMDMVYQLFDGIYFSWDPALFKHKLTLHGMWKRDGKGGDTSTHHRCQAKLELPSDVESDEVVWILLTRHVRSHRAKDEFIALSVSSGNETGSVAVQDELSTKGEYTNSPHVLVKAPVSPSENIAALVASYEGERDDVGFTITVYSNHPASWLRSQHQLLYSQDVEGAFTQKTAGGNHTHPTYYLNPQYSLHIHPWTSAAARGGRDSRDAKATLSMSVSTDRHIPINTMLAWSQGARINELSHNDLALSSGPYSYGFAAVSGPVPPGDYTLVISAFEPAHIGKFYLRLECSDRFDIKPILQEGAGMFSKVVHGRWTSETAGGGPSSGSYTSNPTFELQVPAACQLTFRLQLAEPSPSIALNLTVFNSTTGSSLGRHAATSGPYSDAISGVTIDKVSLQQGRYIAVPSTYKSGVLASFKLIVYSTTSGVQLNPVTRR